MASRSSGALKFHQALITAAGFKIENRNTFSPTKQYGRLTATENILFHAIQVIVDAREAVVF